jgi:hypothetical protein
MKNDEIFQCLGKPMVANLARSYQTSGNQSLHSLLVVSGVFAEHSLLDIALKGLDCNVRTYAAGAPHPVYEAWYPLETEEATAPCSSPLSDCFALSRYRTGREQSLWVLDRINDASLSFLRKYSTATWYWSKETV